MSFAFRAGFALVLLVASPAGADPIPAAVVQQQLRELLAGLGATDGAANLSVTQDGDRDRIALPIPITQTGSVVATVRQTGAGLWAIEDVHIPSPATFSLPSSASATNPGTLAVAIGKQSVVGTVDTSFATKSSIDVAYDDLGVGLVTAELRQVQHTARVAARIDLMPRPDGRLDFEETGEATALAVASRQTGKPAVQYTIEHVRSAQHVGSIDPARVGPLIVASLRLKGLGIAALKEMSDRAPAPGFDKPAALRIAQDFLAAIDDVATDAKVEQTLDAIRFDVGGQAGTLDHAAIGMTVDAPGGILGLAFDIAADGLHLPNAPPEAAAYMLRHLRLRPSLGGVGGADLLRLADLALKDGGDGATLAPAVAALFAHGGIRLGLDGLSVDLGALKLVGDGALTLSQPTPLGLVGEGHVTADGFDALIAQAQASPAEQTALPALILARGLGRQEAGKLAWDLDYRAGVLTVNGTPIPLSQTRAAPAPEHESGR